MPKGSLQTLRKAKNVWCKSWGAGNTGRHSKNSEKGRRSMRWPGFKARILICVLPSTNSTLQNNKNRIPAFVSTKYFHRSQLSSSSQRPSRKQEKAGDANLPGTSEKPLSKKTALLGPVPGMEPGICLPTLRSWSCSPERRRGNDQPSYHIS